MSKLGITAANEVEYELMGFGGNISRARVVRLEMIYLGLTFRGQFLLIEQDWGIMGRNVLNTLPLFLDGPNLTWEKRIRTT